MQFSKRLAWLWGSILGLGLAVSSGCSSAETPSDAGQRETGGAGGSAGPTDGAAVADADASGAAGTGPAGDAAGVEDGDTEAGLNCDECGSPRFTGTCASAEAACTGNAGCAAIRDCVFASGDAQAACPLGPTGAACVAACTEMFCTDAGSAALYRALDECAYCTSCSDSCAAYCTPFADAGAPSCGRT